MEIELIAAIVLGSLIAPAIYAFKSHKKVSKKLEAAEKEVQRLRLLYQKQNGEVIPLKENLENSEKSIDLLGHVIRQKDRELLKLKTSERSNASVAVKVSSQPSVKSKSKPIGKPQSTVVKRMLERMDDIDNGKSIRRKASYVPSPLEFNEEPTPRTVPTYNKNVWIEVDGKLVLRDKSKEAETRRRDSVRSSQTDSNEKPKERLTYHPFAVNSD
ncbi:hypothetical protein [Vibrio sp. 10N.286.48.B8]|uniref:hypothetical protein n=1 Tax=Vibrio sp. 10N.286.48.B8 TaxID=2056189 RepID=UPI0011B27554|nr:hypothetical protein [Vibrio sp. 10N.286.48.B8]